MAEPKKKRKKRAKINDIIGGDILANDFFQKQWRLTVLILILTLLYIDNRYSCQQQLIEIERLKKELTDVKYDALTRNSELMEKSRLSKIEDFIEQQQSDLQVATHPPYLIK